MKYIPTLQHLNHIEFLIKPNLMMHKHVNPNTICSPQRAMCPSKIETL
jgi:hypothetical protein